MTRTVLAASLAAALGLGAMAPAHAGGSFSLSIAPRDARSDDAIRTGLQIYSLFNDIRGGASVRQKGNRNSAGLRQDGRRNRGLIYQEGDGHDGSIDQAGDGNAYGLFQFGRNTDAHVTQRGNGNTGATFVFGW
ncbi:MAG: curlin [Rhizobiaceae bacterium]|nr:curlin [Rhizobiaceae bacterium]